MVRYTSHVWLPRTGLTAESPPLASGSAAHLLDGRSRTRPRVWPAPRAAPCPVYVEPTAFEMPISPRTPEQQKMTSNQKNRYRPRRSWSFAIGYSATCWLVAALAGTLQLLGDQPLGPGDEASTVSFWAATGAVAILILIGYWVIWPIGTTTQSRKPHRVSSAIFGVIYGTSEGVLYVTAWHLTVSAWGSSLTTLLFLFLVIAGYNATWRNLVWDVWVMPVHNLVEWNTRKILWVHAPALLAGLSHLMIFEAPAVFIGFQTIALLGSAVHTRFPPPRLP